MSEPLQRLEEALMFAERRSEDLEARIAELERALFLHAARLARLEAAQARDHGGGGEVGEEPRA
ncbi:MAG: hypothetical protein IT439_06905 [Phycisphaerales bacterium]|nr:hypothetical protein [Phycisphaerales bacterium]